MVEQCAVGYMFRKNFSDLDEMCQQPECVDNLLLYSLDAASKIFRHEPILNGLDTHSLEIFSKLGQIGIV